MRVSCTAELHGDFSSNLKVYNKLLEGVHNSGASILQATKHEFYPQGFTAVVLLAESHVSIHTYPEEGIAYIDCFTCGNLEPYDIIKSVATALGIEEHWIFNVQTTVRKY